MKKRFLSILLLPLMLTSCGESFPLKYVPYKSIQKPLETFKEEVGDIYHRNGEINSLSIDKIDGVNIKTGVYEIGNTNDVSLAFDKKNYCSYSNYQFDPNYYIEQNLLVVPVYFSDNADKDNEQLQEDKRVLLENAFFGAETTTNYQSVASYYNRSSYGHLRIKGEVLDWVGLADSASEARAKAKNNPENYTNEVAKAIAESLSEDIFRKYSFNHEGVLDSLYIVYDYPYDTNKRNSEDTLFWAFVYHCSTSNKVSQYAWSSFNFVGENALESHVVETSTFIHETGHLFGLLDYYNKNSSSMYQPLGFMDMMDYNLGDHSPLSKYLLNWTSPYILDFNKSNSGDITLKPFSETGDFILIPRSDYNNTPYDRYLLISFFAPEGLNDLSNFPSYIYQNKDGESKIFTYPNKYGVLVYEVNAQLGYYEYNSVRRIVPSCFVGETPKAGDYVINYYYDNEISGANDKPLYHLLESSGQNTFIDGNSASNDTMFKLNSTFGVSTFTDLSKEFGVSFKVTSLNKSEATISFTKVD